MRSGLGLALALVGCRFDAGTHGTAGPSDAPANDSNTDAARDAALPDAPADAPPPPRCAEQTTGPTTIAGALGDSSQPGAEPDLTCAPAELPIGFWFDITPSDPPGWNEPTVAVTHVRCGRIVAPQTGAFATTPEEATASTVGHCSGWPIPTASAELDCPSGTVVVGLSGNEGTHSSSKSLFDSVVVQCAQLAVSGAPTGTVTTLSFTDTGTRTDTVQTVTCGSGQALASVGIHTNCGQDALILKCAPVACQ